MVQTHTAQPDIKPSAAQRRTQLLHNCHLDIDHNTLVRRKSGAYNASEQYIAVDLVGV